MVVSIVCNIGSCIPQRSCKATAAGVQASSSGSSCTDSDPNVKDPKMLSDSEEELETSSTVDFIYPPSQNSTQWESIYTLAFITFICSIQFSLYLSSLWPFLNIIDKTATEDFFGYIIATYSLGQIVFSPLVGWWSNRIKQIRLPLYFCLFLCTIGNILYFTIELWPVEMHRKWVLFVSRFITGLGSSNISIIKAYAATASTTEDQSKALAYVTGGVSVGFVCGPMFQLLFTSIGYPGTYHINMYTAPAFLACIFNLIGVLCTMFCFEEKYVNVVEESEENETSLPPPDRVAIANCYFTRFAQMFIQTNLETICVPFTMVMFAFTKAQVVFYSALSQGIMCVLSVATYATYIAFNLDKYVDMRDLTFAATIGLILFHVLTFSWPISNEHVKIITNSDLNSTTERTGCNVDELPWCNTITPINIWICYLSYIFIIGIAFTYMNISLNTVFAQVIGPRRQGTQQGLLMMSGGFARLIGPIVISGLYRHYGPRWAWNTELLVLDICLILWVVLYKNMVPLKVPRQISESA